MQGLRAQTGAFCQISKEMDSPHGLGLVTFQPGWVSLWCGGGNSSSPEPAEVMLC